MKPEAIAVQKYGLTTTHSFSDHVEPQEVSSEFAGHNSFYTIVIASQMLALNIAR